MQIPVNLTYLIITHFNKNVIQEIVFFGGGCGGPYFPTK